MAKFFNVRITIVAILSVVSVTGVVTFASAGAKADRQDLIRTSGAQALNAEELTHLVKRQRLTAYWLGPISGSTYTIIATDANKVIITYLSGGRGIGNAEQRNLVMETVANDADKAALLASDSEVNNSHDSTVTGNTFSYNRFLLDHMTVQINGSGRHVHVYYPQTRSTLTMQTDAEALEKIG